MAKGKVWHDGLKFSCHGCGHCCTFPGGFVYGSEKEFRRIAEYLGLAFETFLERYTEEIDGKVSLVSPDNGPCVFYDKGCSIYPVRPSQCSSYPFWAGHPEVSAPVGAGGRDVRRHGQGQKVDTEGD